MICETSNSAALPVVALVGRPNVGKSSLFNRLTRSRAALVNDTPGLTRDRQYGTADCAALVRQGSRRSGSRSRHGQEHGAGGPVFRVVDTGGFEVASREPVTAAMREQTLVAIQEADVIVFVTDAQAGLLPDDWEIAELLRRSGKPLVCAVNKSEGRGGQEQALEFHRLGLQPLVQISATHGMGMDRLATHIVAHLEATSEPTITELATPVAGEAVRVAVVGCPNAGKSTLINRILGEARLVVADLPGTTRDSIDSAFTDKEGRSFVLVDTAGIRKKSRISLRIEKYSVLAALRAMDRAQVAVLLLDAVRGITDQDRRVAQLAMEADCGLVLAVNKWDALPRPPEGASQPRNSDVLNRKRFLAEIKLAFPQCTHAPVLFLSAQTGLGVAQLLPAALRVWEAGNQRISTGVLNRWLGEAIAQHAPPRVGGRVVKIRYATQVAANPPTLVLFMNREVAIHETYRRYLENQLRERFGFAGASLRLLFRAGNGENPYVSRSTQDITV